MRSLHWSQPDQRTLSAWANGDDATRDGAYAVSLAAVEADLGWVAVARAETLTGADYYLGPVGRIPDLESAVRLEVYGVDQGDEAAVKRRMTKKIRQLKAGSSSRPAMAAVVGFKAAVVVIREAEEDA